MNEQQIKKFLKKKYPKKLSVNDNIDKITDMKNYVGVLIGRGEAHNALKIIEDMFKVFDNDELSHTKSVMERLAMALVDLDMYPTALETIDALQNNFEPYGFPDLLRTKIAYKQKDTEGCINYAEKSLSYGDLSVYNKLYLYNVLTGSYRQIGNLEKSIYYSQQSCKEDISNVDPVLKEMLLKYQIEDFENYLFVSHSLSLSRDEFLNRAKQYNNFFKDIKQFKHEKKYRHKKLRIGYISPDLRFHVVSFFSLVFFNYYDRNSFEVYCYMNHEEDQVSQKIKSKVDHWLNIYEIPRAEVAKIIYKDEIDILFDLSGHTADSVLPILAYKPAPIQICGIGYFDTTGLDTVDYFLADKYLDPNDEQQKYFTEKLLMMEHSHFCFTWHDDIDIPIPPAPCLKNGYVTFGSFNQFAKMTNEVLQTWAKIMDQVPNSHLYLKLAGDKYQYDVIYSKLEAAGLPIDRVRLEYRSLKYVQCYYDMDISLDTFPYPGGGTSCDALFMGVPLITLVGESHNSHFGYSFLMNIGLPELCAFSVEEYIQKAVELGKNPERIRKYHQKIRRKMLQSPVMDHGLYISEIESKYQQLFFNWVNDTPVKKSNALKQLDKKIQSTKKVNELIPLLLQKNSCGNATFKSLLQLGQIYSDDNNLTYRMHGSYWLKKALAADDKSPEAPAYLGTVLRYLTEYVESYEMYAESLRRMKKHPELYNFNNTSMEQFYSHFAKSCSFVGKMEESSEHYLNAFNRAESILTRAEDMSAYLFSQHFFDISSQELFDKHKLFQPIFNNIKQFDTFNRHFSITDGKLEGKIRVGYISPDFRQHVMFAFMYGLISSHDRSKFEIYAYSLCNTNQEDYFTKLIETHVDHFIRMPDLFPRGEIPPAAMLDKRIKEVAERIHNDEIDILFDFAGHTGENPLPIMAYKPAPIQMTGVGYMSTTGLDAIDFFITDEITDPPGMHDDYFTEKLLYMPSQFCYVGRNDLDPSTGSPCKNRDYIQFACFQRYCKITDEMLKAWLEILNRVPNSKLLLKGMELAGVSLVDQYAERLEKLGFDLDRISFESATKEYMQEMLDVDIMLDTYPYPGGGTTCDTLYMGVPVVTLYGERRNTRFAYAILKSIGLEELATQNINEYIDRAVALANDVELLDILHKNLRTMLQNSPIMQHKKFTRTLEEYYLALAELISS